MIRIGILGDIGSGKSNVAKQFGYPVFNADQRKELSKAVAQGRNNIKKINKIVHPEVRLKMNQFLKKNKKKRAVILDIPLLLEGKINNKKDILVFVEAKKKEIIKRLEKRPNFDVKIYNRLRKLQLPLEVKKRKSNFIIKNNFKNNFVKKNVKNILKEII